MTTTFMLGSYINGAMFAIEMTIRGNMSIWYTLLLFIGAPIVVPIMFFIYIIGAIVGLLSLVGILLWPSEYGVILLRLFIIILTYVLADVVCGHIAKSQRE